MSITKIINIEVNDSDVKDLNKDLNSLDNNINKVEGSSKKASKGLKEVGENGGAISTLDALTGGLATKIRDAAEASKLFNISLKGTKTALIATGIGAFVVALGLVVAYWEDISDFITGSNKELERQLDLTRELGDQQQRELDLLDKQDNILKLQGKSQAEINKLKKQELEDVIAIRQEELKLARERLQQLIDIKNGGGTALESFVRGAQTLVTAFATTVDGVFKKLGLDTGFGDTIGGLSDSLLEGVFGTEGELEEAEQRVRDLEDVIISSQNRIAGIELSGITPRTKEKQDTVEGITGESIDAKIAKKQQEFERIFEIEKMQQEQLQQLGKEGLEAINNDESIANAIRTKNDEEWAKARERIAQREADAKRQSFLGYADALSQISGVIGTQTVEGKALAVAASLVNTYASITGQLKAFAGVPVPGYAIAQAIATGVVGFANVKKILDVKIPNVKGASGGGGGVGGNVSAGGGVSAPSFNVVGTGGASQIAQTLNQEQDPVQAYVVAGNVSSAQELNRNIIDSATIG